MGIAQSDSCAAGTSCANSIFRTPGCLAGLTLPHNCDLKNCSREPQGRPAIQGRLSVLIRTNQLRSQARGENLCANITCRATSQRAARILDVSLATGTCRG